MTYSQRQSLKLMILKRLVKLTSQELVDRAFNTMHRTGIKDMDELDIVIGMANDDQQTFNDINWLFTCEWDASLFEWLEMFNKNIKAPIS